jgi:hypothetical protein
MSDVMGRSDAEYSKLEAELRDAKAEIKRANERADRAEAIQRVAVAAIDAGVSRDALPDVVNRATDAGWTLKDGRLVLVDKEMGIPVLSYENSKPMEPDEWVRNLKATAKHLFASPTDGQPQNDGGQAISTGRDNPWSAEGWNSTAQAKVYRESPARAEAMAKAVGSYLGAVSPNLPKKSY